MINSMQMSLVKKDLRGILFNKRLSSVLLIVPLVLTVIIPSILVLAIYFSPEEIDDFKKMLDLFPFIQQSDHMNRVIIGLMLNYIMPLFFMLIPIMSASVMAASSFVGEKEKRTLETLLYCPLSLKEIFQAKIIASFFLSMAVSLLSFIAMLIIVEIEIILTTGSILLPSISWGITMLLVSPAIAFITITFIVRGSAKAQSMEEAQQRSTFLVLPIVLLLAGQFTGILLINAWILLILGLILALFAFLFLKLSFKNLSYETLLK